MDKKKNRNPLFYIIPVILLIGVLVFAVYNSLKIYIPQNNQDRQFSELKQLVETSIAKNNTESGTDERIVYDYSEVIARNSDFKGWLTIDDTPIDYPVMKSSEEEPDTICGKILIKSTLFPAAFLSAAE